MNYIEFGIIKENKKKVYETKKGNLYDDYMLSRYFNDIYLLSLYKQKKDIVNITKYIHDKKDLKANIINLILLSIHSNDDKFYEFGFTLLEKIQFFRIIIDLFDFKDVELKKLKFCGCDISEKFIFFANNFYKDYNVSLGKKVCIKGEGGLKDSIFFSKGISLLYEKNNIHLLDLIIKNSKCGSFDFSVGKDRKIKKLLETGCQLYYPSFRDFQEIMKKNKSKKFIFRNIKSIKDKVYFEVVYGNKETIDKFNNKLSLLNEKHKKSNLPLKAFDLNTKFCEKLEIKK